MASQRFVVAVPSSSTAAARYGSTSRRATRSARSGSAASASCTRSRTRCDASVSTSASSRARRLRSRAPVAPRWRAVVLDRRPQVLDALAGGRGRPHDRRDPVGVAGGAHLQHELQVARGLPGALPVRLVHDEHVGDLQDPRLGHLHRVPPPRRHDDERRVGGAGHLDLGLPHADGLDEHEIHARPRRGSGSASGAASAMPAEVPPRRHRPDEHAGVGRVGLHPEPVAEQRPTGERRGGSMARTATVRSRASGGAHELFGEARLADAGRAGQADRAGAPRVGIQAGRQRLELGRAVLHQRDRAGHAPAVAGEDPFDERFDLGRHRAEMYPQNADGPVRSADGPRRAGATGSPRPAPCPRRGRRGAFRPHPVQGPRDRDRSGGHALVLRVARPGAPGTGSIGRIAPPAHRARPRAGDPIESKSDRRG